MTVMSLLAVSVSQLSVSLAQTVTAVGVSGM